MKFIDQLNNTILLESKPKRIVSLVPSQTELLYALGIGDRIVGVTKFCVHPKEQVSLQKKIGGTKNPSIEKIKSLNPDLIIANKEENREEDILKLQEICPVWVSDINTLEDSIEMIEKIGEIVQESEKSKNIIHQITNQFESLDVVKEKKSVLYLIWKNPFIGVGTSTFINDILIKCGFDNVLYPSKRYPEIEELDQYKPDIIFLSSEPFPFKENHISEIKKMFPNAKVILVDGEMFSWYGVRIIQFPIYFNKLKKNQIDI